MKFGNWGTLTVGLLAAGMLAAGTVAYQRQTAPDGVQSFVVRQDGTACFAGAMSFSETNGKAPTLVQDSLKRCP